MAALRPEQWNRHREGPRYQPRKRPGPRCERCLTADAQDFIPDAQLGWRRPRRVCGQCADELLGAREKAPVAA